MKTKLAIFDLDETLIQGDSTRLWTQYLWQYQIIRDASFLEADKKMMEQYQAGCLDMREYLQSSLKSIEGISVGQIDLWVKDFIERQISSIVYPEAVQTIINYRAQGIPIIIISATVSFIVKRIAEIFDAKLAIGIDIQQKNGCYTNQVEGIPSFKKGKVQRLCQWLDSQGIENPYIYFYTDSANDLPLCMFADEVFVVNADSRLQEIANIQNWQKLNWKL